MKLPATFSELVSPSYLVRLAATIPPRVRPYNWEVEGL